MRVRLFGTQACKALRDEGYETVLVNSNPATIMTDPELAERTYIEPLSSEYLERIIAAERPQALLSTVGRPDRPQCFGGVGRGGDSRKVRRRVIGANLAAIKKAEDRQAFKAAMTGIGLDVPRSRLVDNVEDGAAFAAQVGYPVVLRPSFTLGGAGGGLPTTQRKCTSC